MLQWEHATELYYQIQAETVGQPELEELVEQLITASIQYARIRTDWALYDTPTRQANDARRTAAHNAVIEACNLLSHTMRQHGKDTTWRAELGDDRKIIGDFACYIHCLLGLSAR